MNKKIKAFTLVELIVVITILAILGTIAFISLQGYSASSRDSVRISDVSNMKTSLELFHLNAGKYPLPDNYEIVDYGGETLWYQGTFGTTVVSQLSRNISEIPTDSLSDKEYIYSVANNKNEFQILNLLEGDLALNAINQTNAATSTRIPKVDGQYNGVFIKTVTYIIPTPSLITSEDTTGGLTLDNTNIKSQIITGGKNIPNIGNINFNTGALTGLELSVYTGSVTKNDNDAKKEEIMKIIQAAYTGSILSNVDIYKYILSKTSTIDLVSLLDTVVLDGNTTLVDTSTDNQTEVILDPYWDNVVLLSHMDGVNGSTNFKDEQGHTLIQSGNTQITTNQSVFGGSSLLLSGSDGDYIVGPNSSNFVFGTGDFTIEFWLKITYIKPTYNNIIMDFRPLGGQGVYPTIYYDKNGVLKYWCNSADFFNTEETLIENNWYNIAFSRNSGVSKMFINGVQKGGDFNDTNNYSIGVNGLFIGTGYSTNTYNINGYIDEVRITKGIGRYTTNFDVQTEPFLTQTQKVSLLNTSCKDILDKGGSIGNGIYKIDTQNNGTGIDVYCDMITDGGGWTMIAAQYENDPVVNWNEGIQLDYDPTLETLKGFALNNYEIPNHTQIAFGKDLDPTFIDYSNFTYITGNIPKTLLNGLKTGNQYHIHRNSGSFFWYHDPEYINGLSTLIPLRHNTLTYDLADNNSVGDYTWAFSPNQSLLDYRGYSIGGISLLSSQSYPWTVWVR